LSEQSIVNAVLSFDEAKVNEAVRKALNQGQDPIQIVDELGSALRIVGKKFDEGEFFLMHLVAAAEPVQKVIKDVLEPEMIKRKEQRRSLGRVVLGTVAGDIHDIGKNIVGSMLFAAGFEVYDIGKDIPPEQFVAKAKEINADIVGASALLSTSLPMQREIVKGIVAAGMRDRVKLIFGGAPVTEEWVKEIGGDGYADNAVEAVNVAKRLLKVES